MPNNVKVLHSTNLQGIFSSDEIENAYKNPDGYVGTIAGVMYFRSDVKLKMGDMEYNGKPGAITDMQGEGDNRKGPPSPPRE